MNKLVFEEKTIMGELELLTSAPTSLTQFALVSQVHLVIEAITKSSSPLSIVDLSSLNVSYYPFIVIALPVGSSLLSYTDFITATIPLDELVEKGFNELIHNNENREHSFSASLRVLPLNPLRCADVKILVSPSGNLDQPF